MFQTIDDQVEAPAVMGAPGPEVGDTPQAAIEPLAPVPNGTYPQGRHRARASNRYCFDMTPVRLAAGALCACGCPGAGPNPANRADLGWKWTVLADRWA